MNPPCGAGSMLRLAGELSDIVRPSFDVGATPCARRALLSAEGAVGPAAAQVASWATLTRGAIARLALVARHDRRRTE